MVKLAEAKKWNKPWDTPDPEALSAYQRDIYSSFGKPIFSTKPAEWEALAKQKVPEANFGYVSGSASSFKTYKAVSESRSWLTQGRGKTQNTALDYRQRGCA